MENLSVLVLDHDPVSLLTISKTLARFNFKVLPFQTAAEALDAIERGVAKDEELDLVVAEVHPRNTAMDTLVLFHHILNALKVPLVTMCAYDHVEAVSERMNLGSCFNVLKPLDTETINSLLNKALQHRSTRVLPEGSSIEKKTQGRMDSSSTENDGFDTEEDEEPDMFKAHGYTKKPGRFIWSRELHEKFLQAVEVLGEYATPRNIHRHMNVKNLNLTPHHVASHLQKHRLREQKSKQEEKDYQRVNKLSDLISSAYKAGAPKPITHPTTTQMQIRHGTASAIWDKYPGATHNPINHPTTPQMQIRHGVASSIWDKYPGNIWAQVEESSAKAEVFKANAHKSAVFEHGTKSAWDKYEESLQCYQAITYKRKLLPVKSRAMAEYVDIEGIFPTAAGETRYAAPASVHMERSGSDSMITSLLQQLTEETSLAEAAHNLESVTPQACFTINQLHTVVNLQKDTMNQVHTAVAPHGNTMNVVHAAAMVTDRVADLGSNSLLDGTGSSRSTAEKVPSDPLRSWEEVDAFLMGQPEGQEQQGLGPDGLLQVDDAWNQVLQPAIPVNLGDAPLAQMGDVPAAAQEPSTADPLSLAYDPENQFSIYDGAQTGDAPAAAQESAIFADALSLAYDPENQFSIDDVPIWTPQFPGDKPF
ncbi:unnamed protein product [Alopecurus aequalis]